MNGLVVFLALMVITQAMIIVPYWEKLDEESDGIQNSEPLVKPAVELKDQSWVPVNSYLKFLNNKLKSTRHLMRMAPYKG